MRHLAVTAFVVLVIIGSAFGRLDDDGINDNIDRDIDLKITDRDLDMEARAKSKLSDERVKLQMKVQGFPRFRVDYRTKNQDAKARVRYRVGIRGIIEYAGDPEAAFDKTQIVKEWTLLGKGNNWSSLKDNARTITKDGVEYTEVQTQLVENGQTVTLTLLVSPQYLELNGTTLHPNKLKFGVKVDDFTYVGTDTRMGIVMMIQATADVKPRESNRTDGQGSILIGDGGVFSYVQHVLADTNVGGRIVPIKRIAFGADDTDYSTVRGQDDDHDPAETSRHVVFLIDELQPSSVDWDPEVVVRGDLTSPAARATPASLLAAAAIAVALAIRRVF